MLCLKWYTKNSNNYLEKTVTWKFKNIHAKIKHATKYHKPVVAQKSFKLLNNIKKL